MPTGPQDDRPTGDPVRSPSYAAFVAATHARAGEEARGWLDSLPELIRDLGLRWGLELGETRSESTSLAVDASRGDELATLEVSFPDGWWVETTRALEAWNGRGALRMLEHDGRGARLLERHDPGTGLLSDPDEHAALREAAAVCRNLWIPDPGGVTTVAVEVRAWASTLETRHISVGRPFEREMIRSSIELFDTLGPTQGERVLLHGDLRLRSMMIANERRVALEPHPLVGERAFDAASLLRDAPETLIVDVDGGRDRIRVRAEALIDELGCNPGRLKGWAFATSIDQAVWSCEGGDHALGATIVEVARMIRALDL